MKKSNGITLLYLALAAITLGFASCRQSSLISARSAGSIYTNYEIGTHEWYLTNPVDSVKLYILEYGRGRDTVLVLHGGFGAEHRYLKDAFEGLYDQYHFIFYDQRGSLRSPCPVEKISIQKHVSDIEAIRKELGINKLNLFGHSNGTTLASYYLKAYPGQVKGFVMTACMQMQWPIPEKDTLLTRINKEAETMFGSFIQRPGIEMEKQKLLQEVGIPESKRKTQRQRIEMAAYYIYDISLWRKGKEPFGAFYSNKAANATAASLTQGPYDNRDMYNNHPYPVSIIMGEYDMIDAGGKKFQYWTRGMTNVYYDMVEKAGHDIWIDQPAEFRRLFVKAMKRYNTE